jgi:hypothetical protein
LVAVDPWGQPLWHTALFWESEQPSLVPPPILLTQDPKPTGDPCTNPEDVDGECPSHGAFRPGVHLEKERTTHRPVFVGAYRTLLGDGRLAVVGERLFVTADALVAAVGGDAGELIWLRDRMHGLAVGDQGTVRVALHASAYAVEAVTAAGLLVRFDPLDGSSLRTPTARPEAAVYRLAMSPLVLAWRSKTELRLTSGAAAIDLGAPDHAPLWPGATLNGTLVVPTAEGMLLVDTSEPRPTRLLPWPMGPAQVVVREGLLVVSNDKGVAVLEHGPKPPAAPLPTRLTLAHLGDPSWQVRRAAQTALESRLKREGESIRSRLETLAKSGDLEAAAAARGLIRSSRRGGRWATLLPGVAQATIDAALRGGRDAQIAELVAKLVTGPEATRALAAELLDAQEPAHREVLLSLLLHADRRVRGRMVALVRTSPDPAARRAGAELLVGLARRGGPIRPLAILVKQELPNLPGGPAIGAIVARGNAKLWTKATGGRQALSFAALTQWFRQNPGHYPSPDALFAELTPFFESLCR